MPGATAEKWAMCAYRSSTSRRACFSSFVRLTNSYGQPMAGCVRHGVFKIRDVRKAGGNGGSGPERMGVENRKGEELAGPRRSEVGG